MSCAYRTHRYRASVTAHLASVSWQPPTGHARHPIPLRPPVVYHHRQAVLATADDAPIPVSLVQYLWAQWRESPSEDRDAIAAAVGELMRSPRWHWNVTALPEPSPTDPPDACVSERAGRPTIRIPIDMLREIWMWMLYDTEKRASILQWWDPIIGSSLCQELRAGQQGRAPSLTKREWYILYGYLWPQHLSEMVQEIRRLLLSEAPDDRYTALTVLTRWLESSDHETRAIAAQMLHGWTHVVAAIVRTHPSDTVIRDTLDRMVPTILTATPSVDHAAWVATLWELVTDSTHSERRCQTIVDALKRMMQDPMGALLVHHRLRTAPSLPPSVPAPVWNSLLASLMRTALVGEVLEMIDEAIRRNPNTVLWFDRVVAAGWGTGHDHRILAMVTSHPDPSWREVLTTGLMTSVGAEVCGIIQSRVSPDQAVDRIVSHIRDREDRGDLPLAPLPTYLIPWVRDAVHHCPHRLRPATMRRLWLADPDLAWCLTQTMLDSGHPTAQRIALAAMDVGWGTGHDAEVATTLRARILERQDDRDGIEAGIATVVAGIGIAPPSLIAALLTELAMTGNGNVQRQLISALHRGWGRGQDALVLRIVEMIAARDPSEWGWDNARATLEQAWRALPPDVVVSLIDRLITHTIDRWVDRGDKEWGGWSDLAHLQLQGELQQAVAVLAPGLTRLPPPQVIAWITRYVDHLSRLAPTLAPALVSAWASMIAAGAWRLSVSDIHALMQPLWNLAPRQCLDGVWQWVRR